jgi:hypothetical protein
MTKLVLSGDLSRQLTAVHGCIALCDEAGKTIGFFTPTPLQPRLEPLVSDEEMDRRLREDPSYSTDEVLEYLRTL